MVQQGDGVPFEYYDPSCTEYPPPLAGIFDTPFICIPLNRDWVGFIDGVVNRLTWHDAWGGDEAAKYAAAQEIQKFLVALSGGMCMFQLRQGTNNDCLLEQSFDGGETWQTAFDFSLCLAGLGAQVTNITNQISNTYIETETTTYEASPTTYAPEIIVNDSGTNAAYCYALEGLVRAGLEAYLERVVAGNNRQQIINVASLAIGSTLAVLSGGSAAALGLGIADAVLFVANEIIDALEEANLRSILGDDAVIHELVCCGMQFLRNQRLTPGIMATVWDVACPGMSDDALSVMAPLELLANDYQTFVTFLHAANEAVEFYDNDLLGDNCTDCAICGDWEHTDDFATGLNGWVPNTDWAGKTFGVWTNGVGIMATTETWTDKARGVSYEKTFAATQINRVTLYYAATRGTLQGGGRYIYPRRLVLSLAGAVVYDSGNLNNSWESVGAAWPVDVIADKVHVLGYCDVMDNPALPTTGELQFESVTLCGDGTNPF